MKKILYIIIFLLSIIGVILTILLFNISNKINDNTFHYRDKINAGYNFAAKNDAINIVCDITDLPSFELQSSLLLKQGFSYYNKLVGIDAVLQSEVDEITNCEFYYKKVDVSKLDENTSTAEKLLEDNNVLKNTQNKIMKWLVIIQIINAFLGLTLVIKKPKH